MFINGWMIFEWSCDTEDWRDYANVSPSDIFTRIIICLGKIVKKKKNIPSTNHMIWVNSAEWVMLCTKV